MTSILAAPDTTKVPDEPSILYALTGAMSHHATKENMAKLMVYMERLPMEFQVVCLRDMRGRHANITSLPEIQKWITKNASKLF